MSILLILEKESIHAFILAIDASPLEKWLTEEWIPIISETQSTLK